MDKVKLQEAIDHLDPKGWPQHSKPLNPLAQKSQDAFDTVRIGIIDLQADLEYVVGESCERYGLCKTCGRMYTDSDGSCFRCDTGD